MGTPLNSKKSSGPARARKTARKTARARTRPATRKQGGKGKPFKRGVDPRRGTGKRGLSGRPTIEFKAECDRVAREAILQKIVGYLEAEDVTASDWRWCAEFVVRYASELQPEAAAADRPYVLMGGILPGMLKPEFRNTRIKP